MFNEDFFFRIFIVSLIGNLIILVGLLGTFSLGDMGSAFAFFIFLLGGLALSIFSFFDWRNSK